MNSVSQNTGDSNNDVALHNPPVEADSGDVHDFQRIATAADGFVDMSMSTKKLKKKKKRKVSSTVGRWPVRVFSCQLLSCRSVRA